MMNFQKIILFDKIKIAYIFSLEFLRGTLKLRKIKRKKKTQI